MPDWRKIKPDENAGIRLGLLGNPVEHSLSPKMHTAALRALGIQGSYEAFNVSSEDFSQCIKHLAKCGFTGVNVTVPHKARAARAGIPDDDNVAHTQSANTLLFKNEKVGVKNTDVPGFLACIRTVKPKRALVLGTGGAARSAIFALTRNNCNVAVWGRNLEAASQYSIIHNVSAIESIDVTGADLIVNATPIGINEGEMPPINWNDVKPNTVFFDFTYRNGLTDLLREASRRGFNVIDGRELLVEQGALSFEWWTGKPPPKQIMRAAIGL